ncbi:taurine dioxygenase [bacterium]|nr:taurine dioxygenase [bacterium]
MKIEKISKNIGAYIYDFDLKEQLNPETAQRLRELVLEHEVIFLKNQSSLSPKQYLNLASQVYTPMHHPFISEKDPLVPGISPFQPHEGLSEITGIRHGRKNKGNLNEWHSDLNWLEQPSQTSILRALTLPKVGGDTLWASMSAAYDDLSEESKANLENLRAFHDFTQIYRGCFEGEKGSLERMQALFPRQAHKIALRHPLIDKKAIFVNRVSTTQIVGMSPEESRDILEPLFLLAKTPEYQVRYKWEVNDIAIWDNLLTQHYAVSDYWPEAREMERISIAGIDLNKAAV